MHWKVLYQSKIDALKSILTLETDHFFNKFLNNNQN